jgi:hypothetical protein
VRHENVRSQDETATPLQNRIALSAALSVSRKKGCGSDGVVESLEKQKQLFHPSHRSLEISPKARDFHTPTAHASSARKSGKPKPGFPLSQPALATMSPILILQFKQQWAYCPKERKHAAASPFPAFRPAPFRFEIQSTFMLILGLENAASRRSTARCGPAYRRKT